MYTCTYMYVLYITLVPDLINLLITFNKQIFRYSGRILYTKNLFKVLHLILHTYLNFVSINNQISYKHIKEK